MKILTSTDLKNWSTTRECQAYLPLLIRKLIYAGVKIEQIKEIDFPFGEDVQVGGYDGQLEVEKGNRYIPTGESVWEFGVVDSGKGKKANEDYEKRKSDPLGRIPAQTSYVNITLKTYAKKKKWEEEKQAEEFWSDVRFYDATDIEHWLDLAPSVEIWLARLLNKPMDGVELGEAYWKQWSTKTDMEFPYSLLIDSREEQKDRLVEILRQPKGVLQYVKSNTKEESLAFALATIESLEEAEKNSLQAITLVIENKESFKQIVNGTSGMILLPKFQMDDTQRNGAIVKGHKLIIPVSNSFSSQESNIINLPVIKGDVFKKSLERMGINGDQAQLLSVNTGKDISVLRRSLDFSSKQPFWLSQVDPVSFIPFLLLSRFNSNVEGDKEIIARLTGVSFDDYEKQLRSILSLEETPIYNVGSNWRLISHSDSWLYLAKYITDEDIEKFYDIAVEVLSETNPKYNLDPSKRYMASFYNARPKYSGYLKKGICETLIVLSVLAKRYGLNTNTDPDAFVYRTVNHIMGLSDENLLRSFGSNLMLLAEASPEAFISQIQDSINDDKIKVFFEEQEDLMLSRRNELPSLLWALERLSWMPESLTNVCRILCQLIQLSPDDLPTSNTPFNSLISIFRIWFPQTNATLEERKAVMEIIKKEYPDIAFKLFNSLLYSNDHATVGSKMRWRLFSETREISVTNQELYYMRGYVIDNLIELTTPPNFSRVVKIIEKLDNINWDKIDDILVCIEKFLYKSEENKSIIYHKFRNLIGHHRSYSHTHWALPEEQLVKMETTAKKFEPSDVILKNKYLFEGHHPTLIEGKREDIESDYEKQRLEFEKLRLEAIEGFLNLTDIHTIIQLAKETEDPFIYVRALVQFGLTDEQESAIFDLVLSEERMEKWIFESYISEKEIHQGKDAVLELIEEFRSNQKYSSENIAHFLLALREDLELFRYVDSLNDDILSREYWLKLRPPYVNDEDMIILAVNRFSEYNRPISVLNMFSRFASYNISLSSDFIISMLENLDLSISNDPKNIRVDSHAIRRFFSTLHERTDLDEDRMAQVEFKFIFVFDNYGNNVLPKYLYKSISKNPKSYIDMIKICFIPKDETLIEENKEVSPELKKQIFNNAYSIVKNFNVIPGVQDDNSINEEELNAWIDEVRALAVDCTRIEVTDSQIGQLLARAPKAEGISFSTIIYNVLDRINSSSMYDGFRTEIFNSQGVTVRSPYSGGEIERNKASQFKDVAEKIKITHPNVAKLYRELTESYQRRAKEEDDEALGNIIEY
ncbi:hypothetical protein [Tenacibaculum maritimum]|uniref:hypothetical protein n=2 Tax=Tenacibaculum maritimum TaxID=107401 RepID=UPI0003FE568A|nr:hypothetical protein [Tenacibaculum maritimum]